MHLKNLHMKHLVLTFLISGTFSIWLTGQITVTNAGFPQAGDTLITAVDNLPDNIAITAPGGDQTWNFSGLEAPFSRRTIYGEAADGSAGADFPNATVVANIAEGADGYFKVTENTVELLGLFGADPAQLGLEILTRFNPPVIVRRAPMNFFDVNQSESSLKLPFATDNLPGGIFDQLPISPDSLRLDIVSDRLDIVDAWGTLTTPNGTYEVLREKRTEVRETQIWAKVGILPWADVTALAIGALPPEAADLLGNDTIITHNFFADGVKEPIAVLTLNSDETAVENVEYKSNDITTSVQSANALQPGVYAFPNPAVDNVRFEFSNLEPGNYDLKLFNILGAEVWSDKFFINGNRAIKIDISRLKKGTYLYNLVNDKGKTITTRRLIIVRP